MPTARNARGIDVLIYSQDATRTHTIQVKALSRRSPVPLGTKVVVIGDPTLTRASGGASASAAPVAETLFPQVAPKTAPKPPQNVGPA